MDDVMIFHQTVSFHDQITGIEGRDIELCAKT